MEDCVSGNFQRGEMFDRTALDPRASSSCLAEVFFQGLWVCPDTDPSEKADGKASLCVT